MSKEITPNVSADKAAEFIKANMSEGSSTLPRNKTMKFFEEEGIPESMYKQFRATETALILGAQKVSTEQLVEQIKTAKKKGEPTDDLKSTVKILTPGSAHKVTVMAKREYPSPQGGEKIVRYGVTKIVTDHKRSLNVDTLKSCEDLIKKTMG